MWEDLLDLFLFQRGFGGLIGGGCLLDPVKDEDASMSISWEIIFKLSRSFSPIAKLEKEWLWPLYVNFTENGNGPSILDVPLGHSRQERFQGSSSLGGGGGEIRKNLYRVTLADDLGEGMGLFHDSFFDGIKMGFINNVSGRSVLSGGTQGTMRPVQLQV